MIRHIYVLSYLNLLSTDMANTNVTSSLDIKFDKIDQTTFCNLYSSVLTEIKARKVTNENFIYDIKYLETQPGIIHVALFVVMNIPTEKDKDFLEILKSKISTDSYSSAQIYIKNFGIFCHGYILCHNLPLEEFKLILTNRLDLPELWYIQLAYLNTGREEIFTKLGKNDCDNKELNRCLINEVIYKIERSKYINFLNYSPLGEMSIENLCSIYSSFRQERDNRLKKCYESLNLLDTNTEKEDKTEENEDKKEKNRVEVPSIQQYKVKVCLLVIDNVGKMPAGYKYRSIAIRDHYAFPEKPNTTIITCNICTASSVMACYVVCNDVDSEIIQKALNMKPIEGWTKIRMAIQYTGYENAFRDTGRYTNVFSKMLEEEVKTYYTLTPA